MMTSDLTITENKVGPYIVQYLSVCCTFYMFKIVEWINKNTENNILLLVDVYLFFSDFTAERLTS